MKTVLLNQEMLNYFVSMDPFERRDMLTLPGSFGLGAFMEEEKEDIPAGLILCSMEEDRCVIDWIYTAPDYRGEGIASELMYLAFLEARARGLSEVAACISDEYEDNELEWDTWGFFDNEVFSEVEEGGSVLRLKYEDLGKKLLKEEKLNAKAAGDKEILTLGELTAPELKEAAMQLKKKFDGNTYVSVDRALSVAHPGLSILMKTGNKVTGALLIRKAGNTWYPFYLEAPGQEEKEHLVRAAFFHSEEVCHLKENIEIRIRKPVTGKVLHQLDLPGDEYEITCLIAQMKTFNRQMAMTEMNA